jgi:hypothetical protein
MDNSCRSDKLRACPCLPSKTNQQKEAEPGASVQSSAHKNIIGDDDEEKRRRRTTTANPADKMIPRDNKPAHSNLQQSVKTRSTSSFDRLSQMLVSKFPPTKYATQRTNNHQRHSHDGSILTNANDINESE